LPESRERNAPAAEPRQEIAPSVRAESWRVQFRVRPNGPAPIRLAPTPGFTALRIAMCRPWRGESEDSDKRQQSAANVLQVRLDFRQSVRSLLIAMWWLIKSSAAIVTLALASALAGQHRP
jgi:hypothetical protein